MSPAHTVNGDERLCGKAFLASPDRKVLIKVTTSGCTQHRGDVLSLPAPASTNAGVSFNSSLEDPSHVSCRILDSRQKSNCVLTLCSRCWLKVVKEFCLGLDARVTTMNFGRLNLKVTYKKSGMVIPHQMALFKSKSLCYKLMLSERVERLHPDDC